MSAYDEILKLLKTEEGERDRAISSLDEYPSDTASFTAYLVFRHSAEVLTLALAAIKKEKDERK